MNHSPAWHKRQRTQIFLLYYFLYFSSFFWILFIIVAVKYFSLLSLVLITLVPAPVLRVFYLLSGVFFLILSRSFSFLGNFCMTATRFKLGTQFFVLLLWNKNCVLVITKFTPKVCTQSRKVLTKPKSASKADSMHLIEVSLSKWGATTRHLVLNEPKFVCLNQQWTEICGPVVSIQLL